MLMQELDQSIVHQRNLVTMAQKLDSEVALLERTGEPSSVPPTTTAGVSTGPTKSPRSGRRRRGGKRDQQNSDRATSLAGSVVKDVVVASPDQRTCVSVCSNIPAHSVPLPNTVGFVPPFSSVHPSQTFTGVRSGLVMTPIASVNHTRMPSIRFVNGDDSPARFQKHVASGTVSVAGLRLPRGRQDSSSSTDSAETVRHLEHGTCVGEIDRYLIANAMMQSSACSGPVNQTCGAFATPSAVSSAQGMRFYFRPALLSGVSFPASRSELEQYKQVVHGSAHIPPTEVSTISTPKSQAPRVRQRSPGRGRGRKAASGGDISRSVVPPVATSSVPRFFSIGVVPPSLSVPGAHGVTQPSVTAVHGMLSCVYVIIYIYMKSVDYRVKFKIGSVLHKCLYLLTQP